MKALAVTPNTRKVLIIAGACVALTMLAYVVAHGTLRTFAMGLVVAIAIPCCYFAIERPLLFPFGLYAALVPMEDILSIGHVGTINKILGILAFAALLFALMRRGLLVKPSPGVIAWLALVVWMGLSGFWTVDFKEWQAAYVTFAENFLLYALLSMVITTAAEIETLCTCIVIGGLVACATALWPFMHGFSEGGRLILPSADPYHPADPNRFAAGLMLPLAILFVATLGTRKMPALAANIGALGLLVITIVLTGSRSAMIAVVIMFAYMVLRRGKRSGIYTLLGIGLIAAAPFATTWHTRWAIALSTGGAGRTDIWRVAWIAFKEHWLMGTGFGTFGTAFDSAVLRAPLAMYIGWHRAPHDMLIATGVQLGIMGLILTFLAWWFVFRDLAVPRLRGFLGDLKIALEATVIALFIDAMFLDITDTKYLWLLFFMIALVRSTLINNAVQEYRRRTACAAPSSLTPVPTSVPERLSA